VNPPLVALANGFDGPNGVFKYGPSSFPSETYNSANYWVDVVFATTAVDQLPPVATEMTPSEGATGIASDAQLSIAFSEPVAASSISVVLRESETETIGVKVSYDADAHTLAITPSAPLKQGMTYTVVVTGVADTAGNRMSETLTWTFSTVAAAPPAPVAASPATPAPVSPSAPRCDLRSETITTNTDNGTVTVVTNYNGVQGLTKQTVVFSGNDGGSISSLSIPAWLQSAYNGNVEAIYRDIESGVLANRCAS
jgi:methionine-rich copper-binding protein CopC